MGCGTFGGTVGFWTNGSQPFWWKICSISTVTILQAPIVRGFFILFLKPPSKEISQFRSFRP